MKIRRVYGSILPIFLKAKAFVLYPFIIFKDSKDELLQDPIYLRYLYIHEWAHIQQIRKDGIIKFYLSYIYQTVRYGYRNNSYEIEAKKLGETYEMTSEVEKAFKEDFGE